MEIYIGDWGSVLVAFRSALTHLARNNGTGTRGEPGVGVRSIQVHEGVLHATCT